MTADEFKELAATIVLDSLALAKESGGLAAVLLWLRTSREDLMCVITMGLRTAHRRGMDEARGVLLRDVDPDGSYSSWVDFAADLRDQQDALRDVTGWDFGALANPHSVRTRLRAIRESNK